MKCKVCDKELFVELDFRTLFRMNYTIHDRCMKVLERQMMFEVIPIEGNVIKWMYFFDKTHELNEEFIEHFLIGKAINYAMRNTDWSMVLWMTLNEYETLENMAKYLLLKLANKPIVFLSVFFKRLTV